MTTRKLSSKSLAILLVLAGLIFLTIAGLSAVRYAQSSRDRVAIRRSADVTAIASWMTLHYIARAYSVPEPVLLDAVQVNEAEARHRSLEEIAQSQHQSPNQMIAVVRAAILQYRAQPSTPPAARATIQLLARSLLG